MAKKESEKKTKKRGSSIKTVALLLIIFAEISAFILICTSFAPKMRKSEAAERASGTDSIEEMPPAFSAGIQDGQPRLTDGQAAQEALVFPQPLPNPAAISAEAQDVAASPAPDKPSAAPVTEVPEGSGVLCFVFDDAGHNLFHLEPFLKLPFPCTIAVLPSLAHSAECAQKIREAGKEVILHQPMQAVNLSIDPGPGAVVPGMAAEEIRSIVNANLDEIWPVSGLNNHEGSLITADAFSMEAVFDVIEERSIFFLDSKTIAGTAAPEIAAKRGMRILERAVFLDNSQDREEILAAVMQGTKAASRNGYAVMIGHVWSEELAQILSELYPALVAAGYRIADLSALLASLEGGEARHASKAQRHGGEVGQAQ